MGLRAPSRRYPASGCVRRALVVLAAVAIAASALLASTARASFYIRSGIFDDAQILYGNPDKVFPLLRAANTELIRVNLWWGTPNGVAKRRPARASNPDDPAYDWATYDRTMQYASAYGQWVVFSIIGTPAWANRSKGWNAAPTNAADLKAFAQAAARRYGGSYLGEDGRVLPKARSWIAWNEPNNPVFLRPQYRKAGSGWVIQSARDYARICNAIVQGVKAVPRSGKVACGVTGPRGNNNPNSSRPSVSPLAFLRAMKIAGAKGFDAYAHHPYYGGPSETPLSAPPQGKRGQAPTAVTLGNLRVLTTELNRTYGNMRIWITEYGYQTNPPDSIVGVSFAKQAQYVKQAYLAARTNARVDMFIWFLLVDEVRAAGWQSGLITAGGRRKPSFKAFATMHG